VPGHVSGSRGGFQRKLLHVRRSILQLIRPKLDCVQHPDILPTEVRSSKGLFARWEHLLPNNINLNMSRSSNKTTKPCSAGITPVMVYRHRGPVLCHGSYRHDWYVGWSLLESVLAVLCRASRGRSLLQPPLLAALIREQTHHHVIHFFVFGGSSRQAILTYLS
jgi:hypothetical protein